MSDHRHARKEERALEYQRKQWAGGDPIEDAHQPGHHDGMMIGVDAGVARPELIERVQNEGIPGRNQHTTIAKEAVATSALASAERVPGVSFSKFRDATDIAAWPAGAFMDFARKKTIDSIADAWPP